MVISQTKWFLLALTFSLPLVSVSIALADAPSCSQPTTVSSEIAGCGGCGENPSYAYKYNKIEGTRDVVYWKTSDIPNNLQIARISDLTPGGTFVGGIQTVQNSCFNVYPDMGYVAQWQSYSYDTYWTDNSHAYFSYPGTYGCGANSVWTNDANGNLRCIAAYGAGWVSGYEPHVSDYTSYSLGVNGLETRSPYWKFTGDGYGNCVKWTGNPDTQHIAYSYLGFSFGSSYCNDYLNDSYKSNLVDAVGNSVTVPESSNGFLVKICKVEHQRCKTGCETNIPFSSTANIADGNLSHTQELFSVRGGALPLGPSLHYNSLAPYDTSMGKGWGHSFGITLKKSSDGTVYIKEPGTSFKVFTLANGVYSATQPDNHSTLVKNTGTPVTFTLTSEDGQKQVFSDDATSTSIAADGMKSTNADNGVLLSITDRNNTLNLDYETYTGPYDEATRTTTTYHDLISVSDETRSVAYDYDETVVPHRLASVTDPNQKEYTFEYDGNGQLRQVVYPLTDEGVPAAYWEYTYHPSGNLKTKRDPGGNRTSYEYDLNGRVTTAYDPQWTEGSQGHTRSVVYPTTSGDLRTSTFTEKDGSLWTYTYDVPTGRLKEKVAPDDSVTPLLMRTTSYAHYGDGRTKAKTEPASNGVRLTTFYTYDANGNTVTESVPLDCAALELDPATVVDPDNDDHITTAFRYSYETAGQNRILSSSDERGEVALTTGYDYSTDAEGYLVTTVTDPSAAVTITRQYADGRTKDVTDANGKVTSFTYRDDKQIETITDPARIVTNFTEYDDNGNNTEMKIKDADGTERKTIVMTYDARNRLRTSTTTTTVDQPGIITRYGYDNNDNQTSITDPEGNITRHEYNHNRQVTKTTQYLSDGEANRELTTTFEYGASGCPTCGGGVDKLTAVVDAKQQRTQQKTQFDYDKLGRLEYETDPLGKKYHYTYHPNGLLKEKKDASATPETLLITHTYNDRGQLTRKQYTDGSPDTIFDYDANGRIKTAANGNISYTFSNYTSSLNKGRLKSVISTIGSTSRTVKYDDYTPLGQRKQVTITDGSDLRTTTYQYDNANRPWIITAGAKVFTYLYDKLSRRDTISYPNGITVRHDYDKLDRLTGIRHTTGTANITFTNYSGFDKTGNRKGKITPNGAETYQYDTIYRLTRADTPRGTEKYAYDDVGNRTAGPGPKDTAYTHDAANRMTHGRQFGYGYNDAGNQTGRSLPDAPDKEWTLTWDLENRLTRMAKIRKVNNITVESKTIDFTYDPFGRRIEKKLTTEIDGGPKKTSTWSYLYDGDNIVAEYFTDSGGTTTTWYTHGPGTDEHLAMERNGQSYYFHQDGLGSVTAITNASAAVVQTYEYDSFGMPKQTTNFRNSYTYTGREWDKETGTYHYRKRTYDPMDGRFISKDPIGFAGGDVNLYGYVHNNAINKTDPFGLMDPPAPVDPLLLTFTPDCSRGGCFKQPDPKDSAYCQYYSKIISECADAGTVYSAITAAGVPAGIFYITSLTNGYLTYKLCGASYSTVTTVLGLFPGGKKWSIIVSLVDAALNSIGK